MELVIWNVYFRCDCHRLFTVDRGVTISFIYGVVYLAGTVSYEIIICYVSFGVTRLICVSDGIIRLICVSDEITRLICASDGITRLICASYEITSLMCVSYVITRLIYAGYPGPNRKLTILTPKETSNGSLTWYILYSPFMINFFRQ